ncbi:hypothetical protein [Nostoc sp.]|uniref:hypothetical protein n=1 Tax=Nostoc sp. TaxID=1180 RepID=UPI002FF73837
MKLPLQSLEVSISQRITDGNCDFELLLWWDAGHGCWRWGAEKANLGMEEVAIALKAAHRRHRPNYRHSHKNIKSFVGLTKDEAPETDEEWQKFMAVWENTCDNSVGK